eukprot:COSAG06_NODE_3934_length_4749_cov_430.643656_4_plen_133_part_00
MVALKKDNILKILFKQRPKKRHIRLTELIIAMAIAITITITTAAAPRVQLVVELRVDLPHAPRVVALYRRCFCFCRCFVAFHLPHAPRVMARCCTCFLFALLLLLLPLLLTKMILLRLRLPPAPAKYVWESA